MTPPGMTYVGNLRRRLRFFRIAPLTSSQMDKRRAFHGQHD